MRRRTLRIAWVFAGLLLSPAPSRGEEGEGRAKYVILMIGDGMSVASEVAASRYLHGADRGLAQHALPVQTACTTWDVTCYDRHAFARKAARYAPATADPRIGYDPEAGGDRPYDGTWTPPSDAYFFTALPPWGAPPKKSKKIPATDSASSATALACGVKTDDGNIAWAPGDPPGGALATIAERARARKGAAVGVVSTVPFSHATPAAFAAHNVDRDNTAAIAAEMIGKTRPDVVIGAGHPAWTAAFAWKKAMECAVGTFVKSAAGDFYECTTEGISGAKTPDWNAAPGATTTDGTASWTRRPNGMNYTFIGKAEVDALAAGTAGYRLVQRAAGQDGGHALDAAVAEILAGPPGPDGRRLCGLFGGRRRYMERPVPADDPGRPAFAWPTPENPTLAASAAGALKVLTHRGGANGFFLMVEGGDIDWASHESDYAGIVGAMHRFDEAVKAVLAFVDDPATPQTWENTLLVVTADHANGGLRFAPGVRTGKGDLPRQVSVEKKAAPEAPAKGEEDEKAKAAEPPRPFDPDNDRKPQSYPDKEIRFGAPGSHTNEPVGVYAKGAGAGLIRGYEGRMYPGTRLVDNTHLHEVLCRAMGLGK